MDKIKLKSSVLFYEDLGQADSIVTIRFNSELIKFEDPIGDIRCLLLLLFKGENEREIIKLFKSKYPASDINSYLDTLKYLGLVESLTTDTYPLTTYDTKRWSRNLEFFNSLIPFGESKYHIQGILKKSRVCLIGCGGLGSHILYELAALGIGSVTIIDFDKIDISNFNRQILYREKDIGNDKVITAQKNILEFNSKIKIKAINKKISSTKDISELITGHDIVVCVADKPRDKIIGWLNESCCTENIPFINGGLDLRQALFYSVIPGYSGCVECWSDFLPDKSIQKRTILEDFRIHKDYCAPSPAMSPLISVATGVMVSELIKILTKTQPPVLNNKLKAFTFDTLELKTVETWKRNLKCKCCSNKMRD
ncbi:ThiF family adenylyltransferase [Salmonella enterica]|nr:ThiF family adenylyltransferase [Salmonella enterica]